MAKFIPLEEAAEKIGVSPEDLVEMRSRGDIHGYRDGGSWKFKPEEVDRVREEQAAGGSGESSWDDDDLSMAPLDFGDEPSGAEASPQASDDSAAPEDQAAGGSQEQQQEEVSLGDEEDYALAEEGASTIIGKKEESTSETPAGEESEIGLAESSDVHQKGGSEVGLDAASGSGRGSDLDFGAGSALDLDENELSLDDDDDLVLGASDVDSGVGGSGSGRGSDVTLGGADSGINLTSPSDSGLSLEEPLELGGSDVDSFELPEDDDVIALDDADASPDEATQLKGDEEFQLSGSDDLLGGDDDSGSQVIALEESEGFDESAATMLGGEEALVPEEESYDPFNNQLDTFNQASAEGQAAAPAATAGAGYVAAQPQEAAYSGWNVAGLVVVFLVLTLSGLVAVDLTRNMWSWGEPYSATTSLTQLIVDGFGLSN